MGIQTYGRMRYGPEGILRADEGVETNMMGDEFYPEGLEATIRQAAAVTGIPVSVTENGLATSDDAQRIRYIQHALGGAANCLRDGVDVRGYISQRKRESPAPWGGW